MPKENFSVDSVNVKLILTREQTYDIWRAHKHNNKMVRKYQEFFIDYIKGRTCVDRTRDGEDIFITEEDKFNNHKKRVAALGVKVTDEVLRKSFKHLQTLIKSAIVTSEDEGGTGNAQEARLWHSLLTTPTSNAGYTSKLNNSVLVPVCNEFDNKPWRKLTEAKRDYIEVELYQAIKNNPEVANVIGSPSKWKKKYQECKKVNEEVAEIIYETYRCTEKERNRSDAVQHSISYLKEHGLLPIIKPYEGNGALSARERSAYSQAVASVNSYASWDKKTREAYKEIVKKVADTENNTKKYQACVTLIEEYKKERAKETGTFRLTRRATKGWWAAKQYLRKKKLSKEEVHEYLVESQKKLFRKFGDVTTIEWLVSQPELINCPVDIVAKVVYLDTLKGKLCRKNKRAKFTFAHPIYHPQYMLMDPPNNNNNPKYSLCNEGGKLAL
jgi:hypothetical protein